jgi:hypothetical protein
MPVSISGTNGVTFPDSSLQAAAASPYVLKNRIINGDMRIDQRNAGASVTSGTLANIFCVDRWFGFCTSPAVFTMQQSTDAPAGFINSVVVTVTTPDTSLAASDFNSFRHIIEGLNVADFGWGTANAQSITLSFWVKSSLTGTFTFAFRNSAVNRSYIAPYTINTANTWEKKSVTIAGDTSGTWLTTNGIGIRLDFSLGSGSDVQGTADAWTVTNDITTSSATSVVGTNGATWYVTGVQLEQNTSATPFERRLYGQELAACQRYYAKTYDTGTVPGTATTDGAIGTNVSATWAYASPGTWCFPVAMRARPTVTLYSTQNANTTGVVTSDTTDGAGISFNLGLSSVTLRRNNVSTGVASGADVRAHATASAEL